MLIREGILFFLALLFIKKTVVSLAGDELFVGASFRNLPLFEHDDLVGIGDGRQTELAMYCCTSPECRSKFREADETCFYCDYVEDGS